MKIFHGERWPSDDPAKQFPYIAELAKKIKAHDPDGSKAKALSEKYSKEKKETGC